MAAAMLIAKETGIPFAEGVNSVIDLPHTISYAINYRAQLNSLNELPKDKRPPRDLWNKPVALSEYLEHVWEMDTPKGQDYLEYDLEDIE